MDTLLLSKFIIWHISISSLVSIGLVLTSLGMRLAKGVTTPESKKFMRYFYYSFGYFAVANLVLALILRRLVT